MDKKSLSDYFVSTVAYNNVASLMAKFDDFCAFVDTYKPYKPTIIMLSETWLTSFITDELISLDGYTIFRSDRVRRGGGVCVYISDLVLANFTVTPLGGNTGGIDSLFLKVINSSTTFALGCVYRPSSPLFNDDIILFI
ncbi:hypothetical protein Zmor_026215 [Zophobas morio]|uniref:Uncharacterized protein n=1 Tax=Zophobas morio TaxID=2755281 RepID=A0AA38M504_9CUCU|nr:hypothetical protein Zmor_026215 [Zophobas morio]